MNPYIAWWFACFGRPPHSCVLIEAGAVFTGFDDIRATGADCFIAANDPVAFWGA